MTDLIVEQSPEQAEDAIEHMCFLTDANLLYNHALGLYDLELTLLVAQQAQRVSLMLDLEIAICVLTQARILVNTFHSCGSCSSFLRFENTLKLTTTLDAGPRR